MPGLYAQLDREYDAAEGSVEEAAVAQVAAEVAAADVDEQMAEAERRLAKAAYYKAIVQNGVVEEDGSVQANEVNAEARVWARQRMADLLGLTPPAPPPAPPAELPFTDREVVALKKLVEKMVAAGAVTVDPVVKKVPAPPAPVVKKVGAPAARPAAPPAQPTAAPPAPKKKKNDAPKVRTDAATGKPDYASIPSGEPFRDVDGQIYRFIDNRSYDPDRSEAALRAKGASEEEIAKFASHPRIKSKVAKAGRTTKPMPDRAQMAGITAAQATETISVGSSASNASPLGGDPHADSNIYAHAAAAALKS